MALAYVQVYLGQPMLFRPISARPRLKLTPEFPASAGSIRPLATQRMLRDGQIRGPVLDQFHQVPVMRKKITWVFRDNSAKTFSVARDRSSSKRRRMSSTTKGSGSACSRNRHGTDGLLGLNEKGTELFGKMPLYQLL